MTLKPGNHRAAGTHTHTHDEEGSALWSDASEDDDNDDDVDDNEGDDPESRPATPTPILHEQGWPMHEQGHLTLLSTQTDRCRPMR